MRIPSVSAVPDGELNVENEAPDLIMPEMWIAPDDPGPKVKHEACPTERVS
jgi:hypothetical protein